MPSPFTPELSWLVLTCIMTGLFWIPYILQRIIENGLLPALWDPQGLTQMNAAWAKRMRRAHLNAVENLAIFAPLVLTVQLTGTNTSTTAAACLVYFIARAVHFVVYTLAVPVLRIVAFLVGFGAQAALALTLLGVLS